MAGALLLDGVARIMAVATVGSYGAHSAVALVIAHKVPAGGLRQAFGVSRRRLLVYAWIGVLASVGYFAYTFIDFVVLLVRYG